MSPINKSASRKLVGSNLIYQTDWTINTLQQTWRTTNWPWNNSSPGSNLSSNVYTYDNSGQRLTNTITVGNGGSRTEQYGYDDMNRLDLHAGAVHGSGDGQVCE